MSELDNIANRDLIDELWRAKEKSRQEKIALLKEVRSRVYQKDFDYLDDYFTTKISELENE